jgi:hypothetical protein
VEPADRQEEVMTLNAPHSRVLDGAVGALQDMPVEDLGRVPTLRTARHVHGDPLS